jgi:hypothetical protein
MQEKVRWRNCGKKQGLKSLLTTALWFGVNRMTSYASGHLTIVSGDGAALKALLCEQSSASVTEEKIS